MSIKILDCTLRDGGYVNNWCFSNSQISQIINYLEISNIDIIECGYLDDKKGSLENSTLFRNIKAINKNLKNIDNNTSQKVLMINLGDFDTNNLCVRNDSIIEGIRLAFHKKDLEIALKEAHKIKNLGYDIYFQPMITKNYTDLEFLNMLIRVNELNPKAFYIVDSFGSMSLKEFSRYKNLSDNNLNISIALGYHSHNNMQLAFSNAISLCNENLNRDIILDSSINGIGRGAGNLNTELITDYLNNNYRTKYDNLPLLEAIDEIMNNLMNKSPWGFTPSQFLSATYNCHPNYASYLINKNRNSIKEISQILQKIPEQEKAIFNKDYIEEVYSSFFLKTYSNSVNNYLEFDKNKKILLIGSGKSVINFKKIIQDKISSNEYIVINLNHKSGFDTNYYFFSNQKRFDKFIHSLEKEKVLITSNINYSKEKLKTFNLEAYNNQYTNVALILINILQRMGIKEVEVAGLDGYEIKNINQHSYLDSNQINDFTALVEENEIIQSGLKKLNKEISINLITPSIFKEHLKLNILGVIPARYKSSRFEGKPLAMINGIPMIKRTYNQAKKSKLLDNLIVATDDDRIKDYCESENIPVIMTSSNCLTGTDRIAEVSLKNDYDLYINIQGDEPVINPDCIDEIVNEFKKHKDAYVAYNLYKVISDVSEIITDTIIKTIVNEKDELIYMSRLPIPFNKSNNKNVVFKKQVCVYGFTKKALDLFSSRKKTLNEQYEDIEILRFIDMGERV